MKTVIYLDVLLLVNFLMAWLLLRMAGLLSGQAARYRRLLAASALAALASLILFAPELPYPVQLCYRAATAALICYTAFGWRAWAQFWAGVGWYTAFNLLAAGLALLYIYRTGSRLVQTANLAVYLRISPLVLVALTGLCYLMLNVLLRWLHPPRRGEMPIGLQVLLEGAPLTLRASLDTGCHLKDPMTCLPVLLISYADAKARLPAETARFLEAWFAGKRTAKPPASAALRMIPCHTAAGRTLLPGFAVEEIGLITGYGVQGLGRTVVAFCPETLGGDACEALYGSDFLPRHSLL